MVKKKINLKGGDEIVKPRQIVLIILIAIAIVAAYLYVSSTAHAYKHVPEQVCGQGKHIGNPHCVPSIIDEVTPTEEVVPTVELTPTVEPTATPSASTSNGGGDGKGDGKSDGLHTAPDGLGCAVHACIPAGAPKTGRGY